MVTPIGSQIAAKMPLTGRSGEIVFGMVLNLDLYLSA
jgi:hypothetical protein